MNARLISHTLKHFTNTALIKARGRPNAKKTLYNTPDLMFVFNMHACISDKTAANVFVAATVR